MRLIKKTASIVSSIIIILAIGGYVFVRNFDLNRYKSYIEDIVNRETGRTLKMNGEAKLGISFIPTLVINDVELSNPEWAVNPQMVKLQKLEIKAAILPLLKGRIVIDKLILQQPEIYLETAADGQKSWEFTQMQSNSKAAAAGGRKEQKVKSGGTMAAAAGLVAKQVELQNGIISYFDAKSGKTTQVLINDINLEIPEQDGPFNLNVDAELDGQKIVAEIEADNLASLLNEGRLNFVAEVKALQVSAALTGAVEDVLESPRYAVEGNIYNPAGNFGAPETSLEMRVDGDVYSADINIQNLSVATNVITGTASVDWSKSRPQVKADLNTPSFDVNSLKAKAVSSLVPFSLIKEAQALEMVPNDKIPYEYLNMVDAVLNVKAGKLMLADGVNLTDVVLAARLQDGVLDVSKLDFGLGSGEITATAAVNAATQAVKLNLRSSGLKLQDLHAPLATGANGSMQILSGGSLDIMADLQSSGATYRRLSENLDGQVIAIVDKSEIKTGRLEWLASNIFTKILQLLKVDTNKNTNMDVACAVVRADFGKGQATFPSGIVFNGSKLQVVGSGSINLVNDKINFTIAPTLNKLADGNIAQALASFVKLEGTLEKPKVGIDTRSALTTIVGTVASGGAYLGSEILLNGSDSPCYTALAGTTYASRFPKPSGVKAATKDAYQDVNKTAKDAVKGLEDAAKDILGAFANGLKKGN